jgi:hypothetical protein
MCFRRAKGVLCIPFPVVQDSQAFPVRSLFRPARYNNEDTRKARLITVDLAEACRSWSASPVGNAR